MKKILALMFCLGLGLAQVVGAENTDQDQRAKKKRAHKPTAVTQHQTVHGAQPNAAVQQRAAAPRFHQQVQRGNSARQLRSNNDTANMNAATAPRQFNRNQTAVVQPNRNVKVARQNNVVIRNRNSFAVASQRNWHVRHNHDWWRNHFTTFVLFGGGYYYWDGGYWYPAYGYNPAYSTYLYDEPIYGYNELPPGQVIVNVQSELRREGYYYGAIDGLLGPMTRAALARYQAANGLVITRAIDEPTLQSLGMV